MLPIKLQDQLLDSGISFTEYAEEDSNEVIFSKRSPLDSPEDGVNLLAWDIIVKRATSLERVISSVKRQYQEFDTNAEIARLQKYFRCGIPIKKSEIISEVKQHKQFIFDVYTILTEFA